MAKEKAPESVGHIEERHARLKAESAQLAQEEAKAEADRQEKQAVRDMKADDADAASLETRAFQMTDPGTREQLLEHVRRMRLEPSENAPPPPAPLSEHMQQRLDAELNAGREAVRKAEEEAERGRENRAKAAAELKAYEGHMETVHQPNPGMNEKFPVNKATIK